MPLITTPIYPVGRKLGPLRPLTGSLTPHELTDQTDRAFFRISLSERRDLHYRAHCWLPTLADFVHQIENRNVEMQEWNYSCSTGCLDPVDGPS
jgi:hypothetical protein